MNRFMKLASCIAFALMLISNAYAQILTPQGRLTLTSNRPVLTADVTGATTIYYTPYVGSYVPLYNGTSWQNYQFSQLSCPLNASWQATGQMFDVYVFLNSGTVTLGLYDQGWTNTSGTRYAPTQIQGIWNQYNQLYGTYENGSTTYSVSTHLNATYVGTIYMTGNGQTSVQFTPAPAAGGSNTVIGLWNAYNRVRVTASSQDSTTSWTYSSSSWRDANNSTSNSITWLDGLGQTSVSAAYDATGINSSPTGEVNIGVGINAVATPSLNPQKQNDSGILTMHSATLSPPILGLNTTNAIERVGGGTETFYGNGQNLLTLETEY